MTSQVGVVDYGAGNIGSIRNMLSRIGAAVMVVRSPEELEQVDRVILPGVGHFDHGITQLWRSGLFEALRGLDTTSTPLLGICLGMQLLLEGSDEGEQPGLGLVPGRCRRFDPADSGRKVPHMGWNEVTPVGVSPVLDVAPPESRYYFVHSYYAAPAEAEHVAGTTDYIESFCSVIDRGDGVAGFQFHPEKSHRFGMALLRGFVSAA